MISMLDEMYYFGTEVDLGESESIKVTAVNGEKVKWTEWKTISIPDCTTFRGAWNMAKGRLESMRVVKRRENIAPTYNRKQRRIAEAKRRRKSQ